MKISVLPRTNAGKWAFRLIIIFLILFIVFNILVAAGQRGGNTFADNLFLSIPALSAGIAVILSFFAGLISIFKYKEHSLIIYLSTLIGFIIFIFLVGEFSFPH